ncbi:hypothetical protein ACOQJ4_23985, partial [Klebsiella pneumoniae]
QTETEATGAPQKHHYTLNQQVGSITQTAMCLHRNYKTPNHLFRWRKAFISCSCMDSKTR